MTDNAADFLPLKGRRSMKTHELFANPDTVHWGTFDHRLEPVLTVARSEEHTSELQSPE